MSKKRKKRDLTETMVKDVLKARRRYNRQRGPRAASRILMMEMGAFVAVLLGRGESLSDVVGYINAARDGLISGIEKAGVPPGETLQ